MKSAVVAGALVLSCLSLWAQGFGYAAANAPYDDAKFLLGMLSEGSFSRASEAFDDGARASYSADALQRMWFDLIARYGPLQDYEAKAADVQGTSWRIHILCTFQKGKVDALVTFDSRQTSHKALSLTFTPTLTQGGPFPIP